MNHNPIQEFIDKSIEEQGYPDFDPFYITKSEISDPRFIDESKPERDDQVAWKAIPSLIEQSEINELENKLKIKLPNSFQSYLNYKNFYSIFDLTDVGMFCPLIPKIWKEKILEATFNGYPREFIYDKGLIPFADYSDWGLTCFDTTIIKDNGEFDIVIWDHERPNEKKFLASSFTELCTKALKEFED